MKLPIKDVLPIVTLMHGFTADRDTIPALKHIFFSNDTIRAFSGMAGAVWKSGSAWFNEDELAIQSETLQKVLQSLYDQGVEDVEMKPTPTQVNIRGASFKGSLGRLALDSAPTMFMFREPPTDADRFVLDDTFWSDFDRITFAVCKDENRAPLRGMFWAPSGRFYATDGFRIATVVPSSKDRKPPVEGGLLIPDHIMLRLADRRISVKQIAVDESVIWCFLEEGAVYGSLIEDKFPIDGANGVLKKAQSAIKNDQGAWVQLPEGPAMDLIMARLLLFAEAPTFRMRCSIEKDTLRIATVDPAGSVSAEEAIPVKVTGKSGGSFAVNGRHFREMIKEVGLTFWYGPECPLYFRSKDKKIDAVLILFG